ncbi:MAG TPA: ABC transporter ATP-binding protein, partial [Deinococcales bacterium]|nr:ABC transporter ATP-binding protein [Deinococcales bacterium]
IRSGRATPDRIALFGMAVAGAALLSAGFNLLQRRQMIVASRQIEAEIRADVFRHLATLDRNFYDRSRTGDLMNRLATDLGSIREVLGPGINMGSRTTLMAVGALVAMFTLRPSLAALVAVAAPLMVGVATVMRRLVAGRYQAAQVQLSAIAAQAQENFSGARVVRGYALEARELAAFDRMNARYIRLNLSLASVEAALPSVMGALLAGAWLTILLVGGRAVVYGEGLTVGQYVAFTSYLTMLAGPVVDIGRLLTIYQRGATSWARLGELLDVLPQVQDSGRTDRSIKGVRGDLDFRKVTLRAGGATLLEDVNLRVPAGTSVGITGRTGAGKSVLASLITRQVDPTEGQVLLDGHDLREVPLRVLRENVSVVPQEPFLFSESIADNIAFGLPPRPDGKPDLETVRWAARLANLDRDVQSFPAGYDTMLGERGVTLSGGQRQRTAIARAIARRPPLLVLDDALSAVDTETERGILDGLRNALSQGSLAASTVVLVSHRASTLRLADQVVVLERGRVVEAGRPDDLLAAGGHYAELVRRQSQAADTDPDEEA